MVDVTMYVPAGKKVTAQPALRLRIALMLAVSSYCSSATI